MYKGFSQSSEKEGGNVKSITTFIQYLHVQYNVHCTCTHTRVFIENACTVPSMHLHVHVHLYVEVHVL